MENAAKGQTIHFKSSEQLIEQTPAEMLAKRAPVVPGAQAPGVREIQGEGGLVRESSVTEMIPANVGHAQLVEESLKRCPTARED